MPTSPKTLHDKIHHWADGHSPTGFIECTQASLLRGASWLYGVGAAATGKAFDLGLKKSQNAGIPVFCIGNLSVGGTGKTPLVMETARILTKAGRRVATVSRGYRRADASGAVIVSDGQNILCPIEQSGDEPLMMARALPGIAIIVGARRYEAAMLAREKCQADAIVLDDGFQHRALQRNCDIVLWDTLRPLESSAILPRGLMREGFSALKRAHALILTRVNLGHPTDKVVEQALQVAPHLEIFHAGLQPIGLRSPLAPENQALESPEILKGKKVAAFCGLGNPESFWRLIEQTGAELVDRTPFPDHHRPTEQELDSVATRAEKNGAEMLLITEKDAENTPETWDSPLPLRAIPVEVTLGDDHTRYQEFLLAHLQD